MSAVVDDTGHVRDVRVVEAPETVPEWPEYTKAVVEQVKRWEYEPAKSNGVPLPLCMTIVLRP